MTTLSEAIDALNFDIGDSGNLIPDPVHGDSNVLPARIFTYQISDSQPADLFFAYTGWTTMTAAELTAYRDMLAYTESLINVDFQEVTGNSDPDINVGKVDLPAGIAGFGGFAYNYSNTPTPHVTDWDAFAVYLNTIDLANNQDALILHEIGHALGMKHPFTNSPNLPPELDNNKYTVMSYTANPDNSLDSDGYMLFDIAALQQRWGANLNTATGDNYYTGKRNNTVDVIWDAGGIDTLDASGYSTAVSLNLTQGTFSRFGTYDDVAIAYGVSIENAVGGDGADTIVGNDGNNVIEGGGGADMLDGGLGDDTLSYASSSAAVNVNFVTGAAAGGDAAGDAFSNFENLTGSQFADFLTGDVGVNTISGLGGNDIINGSSSDDVLLGGIGDDMLIGGAGVDIHDGGAGSDTANFFNSSALVQIDLTAGTATGGYAAGDTLLSIENVVGSIYSDRLIGDSVANKLTGGRGSDILIGNDGDDTLEGQQDDDELIGGAGADFLNGGAGVDEVVYSASTAGVTARIGGISTGGDAQGDTLYGVEDITGSMFDDFIVGSNLANRLVGNDGNDTLNGATNADELLGGSGDDVLIGGDGADILDGGEGVDTASYFSSVNGVWVNLSTGAATLGQAAGDTLISIENLNGSHGGADRLTGDNGDNRLEGFAGSDWLNGGFGNDTLRMGNSDGAQDRALYGADGFGNDTISQFENGTDIIDTRGLGLTFADVTTIQTGMNTVVSFVGISGQITFFNFLVTDIDSTDFYFG